MDLTSALKNDILRPLGTIFIPAAVAVTPSAYFIVQGHSDFLAIYKEYTTATNIAIVAFLFVVGMYFEDIGSHIEQCFYRMYKTQDSDDAWHAYLKSDSKATTISSDYLMTVVARMKFELSMIPAIFLGTVAGLWTADKSSNIGLWTGGFWTWAVIAVLLLAYTVFEVRTSVRWLDKERRALFKNGEQGGSSKGGSASIIIWASLSAVDELDVAEENKSQPSHKINQ